MSLTGRKEQVARPEQHRATHNSNDSSECSPATLTITLPYNPP